jgi:hypothetical protein
MQEDTQSHSNKQHNTPVVASGVLCPPSPPPETAGAEAAAVSGRGDELLLDVIHERFE